MPRVSGHDGEKPGKEEKKKRKITITKTHSDFYAVDALNTEVSGTAMTDLHAAVRCVWSMDFDA